MFPETPDRPCEENEGGRHQQPVGLTGFLQEVPERGRGTRGVPEFPPARPQGRAVTTPRGQNRCTRTSAALMASGAPRPQPGPTLRARCPGAACSS